MTEPSRIYSRAFVKYKRVFDRKVDRNADRFQQTITNTGEQEPALQATGRTATNSHGQARPYSPFGITRLSLSTDVFHPLHKPIEFLPSSTEIYCCPPVLLSVLLSKVTGKCRVVACSRDLHTKKKEPQPTKIAALSIFVHDSSSIAVSLIWVRMITEDDCRDNEGVEDEM